MKPAGTAADEGQAHASLQLVLLAALAIWGWVAVPLALGRETLFLGDAFFIHLPYKAFGAQQLAEGNIPATIPWLGLGLPFRGNPQALAFYPGNLLYLLLPFWSAFNLHYALHWLLGLFSMRALARGLGQSRPAALLAGLAYAGGGIVLSALCFYNLLTVLAWWPLVMLGACRGGRRGIALGGLACGMALLGGEPVTAALGILPLLVVASHSLGWRRGVLAAATIGLLGLLVALPQLVATARIAPESLRGAVGFDAAVAAQFALHPLRMLELVLPYPFGWPARGGVAGFWAKQVTPGPPFFSSLYFGVVAVWLASWACRSRPVWAGLSLAGLGCAWLGGSAGGVLTAMSFGLFRYPEKFLLWLALAGALLAGFGLDWVASPERSPKAVRTAIWAAAVALALALAVATLRAWWLTDPAGAFRELVSVQGARLAWSLGAASLLLGASAVALRRQLLVGLVGLQLLAVLQLAPLVPRVPTALYRQAPPWMSLIPPGAAVHSPLWTDPKWQPEDVVPHSMPGAAAALHPTPGVLFGLTYPLSPDFEGLGSAHYALLSRNLVGYDWQRRVRLCRALGVDTLVGFLPIESPYLDLLGTRTEADHTAYLYRVRDTAPLAWWPKRVTAVASPLKALAAINRASSPTDEAFVPAVFPHHEGGTIRLAAVGPDRLVLDVESGGGLVVVRRAFSSLWRARAGDLDLAVEPTNLVLTGVRVPAGSQQVELSIPSSPEKIAGAIALLVAAALLWGQRPR